MVLLAVISAALGTTSLFYAVLDNAWVTLIGVLLTFALLVQFASVLSDVERTSGLTADRGWLRTFVANPRRLIESIVDFGLMRRTKRASPVDMGTSARSRKLCALA